MLRVGIIGYGYWGPNVTRNFNAHPECAVVRIADGRLSRRKVAASTYKQCEIVSSAREITRARDIDIVVVATPVGTHGALAAESIRAGKHVWIEKPLASSVREARRIRDLARKTRRVVAVDHTFLFDGAVRKMKEIIDQGEIGRLYYYDSTRVNLGLFQRDVNVLWDLAVHDLAVMDYLLNAKPRWLQASVASHFRNSPADVGYLTLMFGGNLIAHLNVSWLSPVKIRSTIVGGERRMLVWNHLEPEDPLKIYDKGVAQTKAGATGAYEMLPEYRVGNMYSPAISRREALQTQVQYFVECIRKGRRPFNGAEMGLRVVRLLEAADRSIKKGGRPVKFS